MRNPWKTLLSKKLNSYKLVMNKDRRCIGKRDIRLTWENLRDQFELQKGRCYWLGVKIEPQGIFESWNHLAPSIDRLDTELPYQPGNIVITTRFANLGRGMLTEKQFIPQIKKLRKQLECEMFPVHLYNEKRTIPSPEDTPQCVGNSIGEAPRSLGCLVDWMRKDPDRSAAIVELWNSISRDRIKKHALLLERRVV